MITKLESRKNEVWMIWPEDAELMLKKNYAQNRPIGKSTVLKYANDMKNGNWGDTPTPIIVTKGGMLLDGQHRLSAVIEAGIPIVFEVRVVSDDILFKYLDNGKARRVGDYIHVNNKVAVASVGLFAYCAVYGRLGIKSCYDGKTGTMSVNGKTLNIRADRIGVSRYVNEHRDGLEPIALEAIRMYKAVNCITKKAYGAALWLLATFNDVDLTREFVDEFCKAVPDSKSVYAGKAAIVRAGGGKAKPDIDWSIGTVLDIYQKFVDCADATRFTSWKSTLESYETKIQNARAKRTET